MRLPQSPTTILLLLATHAQAIYGNPAPELMVASIPSPSTCGPTTATVAHVTTTTIGNIVTLTHSCYTHTSTTRRNARECPTLIDCGVHPACIIVSIQTIDIPSKDACCTSIPTSLVAGPCPTCQTGCDVSIATTYITSSPTPQTPAIEPIPLTLKPRAAKAKAEAQAAPTCYTTVINSDPIPTGTVQTVFAATVTKTSMLTCKGCGIVTKFLNGFGPASQYAVTSTAVGKTTTVLAYSCL